MAQRLGDALGAAVRAVDIPASEHAEVPTQKSGLPKPFAEVIGLDEVRRRRRTSTAGAGRSEFWLGCGHFSRASKIPTRSAECRGRVRTGGVDA
jgi:hypothetical protein